VSLHRRNQQSAYDDRSGKLKLSARNILKGTIVGVVKGQTTAHVQLNVNGTIITVTITNEGVDELGLKAGIDAAAIIKSSGVMTLVS
jgi:molybdopterin-binding protein